MSDRTVEEATRDDVDRMLRDRSDDLPATRRESAPAVRTIVPGVNLQTPALGQRAVRPDIRSHLVGGTRYIADLHRPGMLHVELLRSAEAHARVRSIDLEEARAMPGVVATLTGAEVPVNSFGSTYFDQPVLASEIVRHRGDPVVAVAAETRQQARDAIARIRVDYEPLPAVFDPLEALEDDAPRIHGASNVYTSKTIVKGDVDAGMAESAFVVSGRYRTQMIEHVPLEPHAALAEWHADGRLHIHATNGRVTLARADLARTLDMPMNKIVLQVPATGGNFGGKNEIRTEPVVALIARKTGRPAMAIHSREEEFTASTVRHPIVMDYETGVAADGRLLARSIRLVLDGGAYASWSETTVGKAAILAAGPYRIPNVRVEAMAVYTNKTVTGAMRGFGAPQVCFAYESQMDEIATRLGVDPIALRLRNGFGEGSISHTGQVLEAVALEDTLRKAAETFGWEVPE